MTGRGIVGLVVALIGVGVVTVHRRLARALLASNEAFLNSVGRSRPFSNQIWRNRGVDAAVCVFMILFGLFFAVVGAIMFVGSL